MRTPEEQRAIGILHALVATPSISGHERCAVDLFVRHAGELGFSTEIDAAGNGMARLRGRGPITRTIVLLGHIDTVPGDIPVRIEHNIIHGRGSADAKGPLCAMLLGAASRGAPDGVEIIVAAAVGEETTASPGAHFLRDQLRPDACIVGEPSAWDAVTLGYKGRLVVNAQRIQESAHSAGPDASPADTLFAWWGRVSDRVGAMNCGRTRAFDEVQATIISMRTGADGLASSAVLRAGFRLPPGLDPHDLEQRLRVEARELGVELSAEGHEQAHATTRIDPVVRALSAAIRNQHAQPRHKLKTGTADLNVVAPVWKCPIAAYGPGDSALDHTPHEHLHLDEYLRSIRVIADAIPVLASELHDAGVAQPAGVAGT